MGDTTFAIARESHTQDKKFAVDYSPGQCWSARVESTFELTISCDVIRRRADSSLSLLEGDKSTIIVASANQVLHLFLQGGGMNAHLSDNTTQSRR